MKKPTRASIRQAEIRKEVQQRFAAQKRKHLKMLARKMGGIRERKISAAEYSKLMGKIARRKIPYLRDYHLYVIESALGKEKFTVEQLEEKLKAMRLLRHLCSDGMKMAVLEMTDAKKRPYAEKDFAQQKEIYKRADKAFYDVMQELIVQKKIEGKEQPKAKTTEAAAREPPKTIAEIKARITEHLMNNPPADFPEAFSRLSPIAQERYIKKNKGELFRKLVQAEKQKRKKTHD